MNRTPSNAVGDYKIDAQMADWKASLEIAAPPERIYVSMGTSGIRMFTIDQWKPHDGPVTVYVQESALINHGAGEYVRGHVTTNGIDSVFAVLKRGLVGVYHHASSKRLGRYVNEFAFRLNDRNVKNHTLDRLNSFILASSGRRLTYRELTA